MSHPTDEKNLLERLRADDERALDALFRTWHGYLFKIAFSMLGNADAAQDAVQEVFVRFWHKRHEIEVQTTLKGYLQRSIVNQCLAVLRQQKPVSALTEHQAQVPDTAPSAPDTLHADSLETLVHAAIERLPEQCRLIFRLSRFDELSRREIAEQLDISLKTVENQIGKALRILRDELAPWLSLLLPLAASSFL
jgi:RNA polymerase sigma-70 factor (ECF subfamily)